MRGKPHFPPPGIISGAFNDSFIPGNFPPNGSKRPAYEKSDSFPSIHFRKQMWSFTRFFPNKGCVLNGTRSQFMREGPPIPLLPPPENISVDSQDSFHQFIGSPIN
jgi:hypothetical protein